MGLPDGGQSPERTSHDQTLGIFSPRPHPPEKGEGLEVETMMDQPK